MNRDFCDVDELYEVVQGRGFRSQGQFAAGFQRHFGELPSETVRGR